VMWHLRRFVRVIGCVNFFVICISPLICDSLVAQALKIIKKLMECFPIKRAPLRVRITAPKPKFAGLMEKVVEWNAIVISKDESGNPPSVVSLLNLLPT
jgi:ribosome maturation protein Sdo1